MKFREVRATAFGPFRNATLTLSPGMNVVHGPNEAGKSSWFAATYAGLAGRRRSKGRGTLVQAEFSKRHKPWSGSLWSAGVTVALDDGTVLAIEHDLRKGESKVIDGQTGRVLSGSELGARLGVDLIHEGTIDGSRLLGLNRDSVRATIFTGQADMLRVLTDAKELQEFIERAATTEVADSTAEGALAWLTQLRSERVGVEHIGNKPLRTRTAELAAARHVSSERRDGLNTLVSVLEQQQGMAEQLARAKADLETADAYDRWMELRHDRDRLQQAVQLTAQIEVLGDAADAVDEAKIHEATKILGAYDAGSAPAPLEGGRTSALIAAEIATLPAAPTGDVEPQPLVLTARQAFEHANTALATHAESAPDIAVEAPATTLNADELRSLADILASTAPGVDPEHRARLAELEAEGQEAAAAYAAEQAAYNAAIQRNEQRRVAHEQAVEEHARRTAEFDTARAEALAQWEAAQLAAQAEASKARGRGTALLGVGIALALIGGVLAAALVPGLGIAVAVVGVLAAIGGLVMRSTKTRETAQELSLSSSPPPSPALPVLESVTAPTPPQADARVQDLQVTLRSEEAAVAEHEKRITAARAQVASHDLPADPIALRALARAMEDAAAAVERRDAHAAAGQRFVRDRDLAAQRLADALRSVGMVDVAADDPTAMLAMVDAYVESCATNAALAVQAGRKDDLVAELQQRRHLEAAHQRAVEARAAQEAEVAAFVRAHLGSGEAANTEVTTAEQDAGRLREWLAAQQQGRTSHAERAELSARLDQLLEGGALDVQQQQLAEREAALGPEPEDLPADLIGFRATVTQRHEAVVGRVGELVGQQEHLAQSLGSVAEALEAEAIAERRLAQVQALRTCIGAAIEQLQLAKDRAHANIAPALEAKIRPWLPRVTDGRYLDVTVEPSDLTMKVTEVGGAAREARLLSQGTMEQIFLILRIALSQVLSGDGESAPFVLDDVTVQSDQDRTRAILQMLHSLSQERQIVLFTQEPDVVDWAESNLGAERDQVIALVP